MSINIKGMLGGAARVAAGAALLVAAGSAMAPAHAAKLGALIGASPGTGEGDGPLLATYFDIDGPTGIGGDAIIRLANISGAVTGECAFIYVFNTDQELEEACAAPLSPNKELAISVYAQLNSNPAFNNEFGYGYRTGLIEIVSGEPNTGSSAFSSNVEGINCDPAGTIVPVTAVEAWIEHTLGIPADGYEATGVAVVPFTNGGAPDVNLGLLTADINFLNAALGSSGDGICYPNQWVSDASVE